MRVNGIRTVVGCICGGATKETPTKCGIMTPAQIVSRIGTESVWIHPSILKMEERYTCGRVWGTRTNNGNSTMSGSEHRPGHWI